MTWAEDGGGAEDSCKTKREQQTQMNPTPAGRLLACPYFKMDPVRYSPRNPVEKGYRGCSSCYLATIARLKQHLYRVHSRPEHYCARCYKVFSTSEDLQDHFRQMTTCEVLEPVFAEKMTADQTALVQHRGFRKNEVEAWYDLFRAVFPGSPSPASPYVGDNCFTVGDTVDGQSEAHTASSTADLVGMDSIKDRGQDLSSNATDTPCQESQISWMQVLDPLGPEHRLIPVDGNFRRLAGSLGAYHATEVLAEHMDTDILHEDVLKHCLSWDDDTDFKWLNQGQCSTKWNSQSGTSSKFATGLSGFDTNKALSTSSFTDYDSASRSNGSDYPSAGISSSQRASHRSNLSISVTNFDRYRLPSDENSSNAGLHSTFAEDLYTPQARARNITVRMLDVGSNDDRHEPFLVEVVYGEDLEYLILTCDLAVNDWTNVPTTRSNTSQRYAGTPLHTLPGEIRYAVELTRNLGCQYLWNYHLCMLQDDLQDYEVQHKHADMISRNAIANIAVAVGQMHLRVRDDSGAAFEEVRLSVTPPGMRVTRSSESPTGEGSSTPLVWWLGDHDGTLMSLSGFASSSSYRANLATISLPHKMTLGQTGAFIHSSSRMSSQEALSKIAWHRVGRAQSSILSNLKRRHPRAGHMQNLVLCSVRALHQAQLWSKLIRRWNFSLPDFIRIMRLLRSLQIAARQQSCTASVTVWRLVYLPSQYSGKLGGAKAVPFLGLYQQTRNLSYQSQLQFFKRCFYGRQLTSSWHQDTCEVAGNDRKRKASRDHAAQRPPAKRSRMSGQDRCISELSKFPVEIGNPAVATLQEQAHAQQVLSFRCLVWAAYTVGIEVDLPPRTMHQCSKCGTMTVQRLKDYELVKHGWSDYTRYLPADNEIPDYDDEDNWNRLWLKQYPVWLEQNPLEPLPCPYTRDFEGRRLRYASRYNLRKLWATSTEWEKEVERKRSHVKRPADSSIRPAPVQIPEAIAALSRIHPVNTGDDLPENIDPVLLETERVRQRHGLEAVEAQEIDHALLPKTRPRRLSDGVAPRGEQGETPRDDNTVFSQFLNEDFADFADTASGASTSLLSSEARGGTSTLPSSASLGTGLADTKKLCRCAPTEDPSHRHFICQQQFRCNCELCDGWRFNSPEGQRIMEKLEKFEKLVRDSMRGAWD